MTDVRPLPQEREKHLPRVGNADALGFRTVRLVNDRKTELAAEASELLYERAGGFSLSPGERVRVRASVTSNIKSRSRA